MASRTSNQAWSKSLDAGRTHLKPDGTLTHGKPGEVKGKHANGVGSLYSCTLPRNIVYPALLTTKHRTGCLASPAAFSYNSRGSCRGSLHFLNQIGILKEHWV